MLLLSKAAQFLRRNPDDVWAELPMRGLTIAADIVAVNGSADASNWQLHYRFELRGVVREGEQTVPRAVAEALRELGRGTVRYLPDQPDIHRLVMPR